MTPQEWQALSDQHGGIRGTVAVDPQLKVNGIETGPNPTPAYRYNYADGTYVIVRIVNGAFNLEDPGTAIKKTPAGASNGESVSAPPNQKYIYTRLADGTLTVTESKNYVEPPANTNAPSTKVVNNVTYEWDPATHSWVPSKGLPAETPKPDKPADPTVRKGADGREYQWNPATNTWELAMPDVEKAVSDAKARVDAETAQLMRDVAAGTISPEEALAKGSPNVNLYVEAILKKQENDRQAAQFQQTEGRLSAQNATQESRLSASDAFNQSYQTEQLGQSAGNDAVDRVLKTLPYRVGPNFGANFAAGLNTLSSGGGPVHFDPGDFTYQMPDFNEIARQATAQALAHISPHAAAIVGAPIPSAGPYNPAAVPSYVDPRTQAAPVVAPVAYTPHPPSTNPNLTNPTG